MNDWTVWLEEDAETGDLVMPIPPELLAQLGWNVGETLIWQPMKDGTFILRKKQNGTPENSTE
jgi:hypothetical protein